MKWIFDTIGTLFKYLCKATVYIFKGLVWYLSNISRLIRAFEKNNKKTTKTTKKIEEIL